MSHKITNMANKGANNSIEDCDSSLSSGSKQDEGFDVSFSPGSDSNRREMIITECSPKSQRIPRGEGEKDYEERQISFEKSFTTQDSDSITSYIIEEGVSLSESASDDDKVKQSTQEKKIINKRSVFIFITIGSFILFGCIMAIGLRKNEDNDDNNDNNSSKQALGGPCPTRKHSECQSGLYCSLLNDGTYVCTDETDEEAIPDIVNEKNSSNSLIIINSPPDNEGNNSDYNSTGFMENDGESESDIDEDDGFGYLDDSVSDSSSADEGLVLYFDDFSIFDDDLIFNDDDGTPFSMELNDVLVFVLGPTMGMLVGSVISVVESIPFLNNIVIGLLTTGLGTNSTDGP